MNGLWYPVLLIAELKGGKASPGSLGHTSDKTGKIRLHATRIRRDIGGISGIPAAGQTARTYRCVRKPTLLS
jgi:hypothetical protein